MTHYYSKTQTSDLQISTIQARLRGKEIKLSSGSGVFSVKKIDRGTELLIEECHIKNDDKVLDLGCGYGAIGVALGKSFDIELTMTDINQRAARLAKINAKQNGVKATVKDGDMYKPVKEKKFDAILTNPPYTAGRAICYKMIEGAKDHLEENGTLQLVARHQKGGKTLEKKMEEVFGNVEVIGKGAGYRVYLSKNSSE